MGTLDPVQMLPNVASHFMPVCNNAQLDGHQFCRESARLSFLVSCVEVVYAVFAQEWQGEDVAFPQLMSKTLRIKFKDRPAVIVYRAAFMSDRLVYVGRANKFVRYPWGRSHIIYIGTTAKGARRVASSAASKGEDLLFHHGVRQVEFVVITCERRQGVCTWKMLERALLIRFRELFGAVPRGNFQGKKIRWKMERRYFTDRRLDDVIKKLG